MVPSSRIPLLIVGGGIGGLATAIATAQAGWPVHVLEKAEHFSEIGAGLQLAPNATRALDRLGIFHEICRHCIFPRYLVMMDALSGERITRLDLGEKFRRHFGYPYVVMHRGDLLGAELQACRSSSLITLETDKEVIAIEDLGNGARVTCADGAIYECDALVGADGLWSIAREVVHPDGPPICAEFVAYRGTVPLSEMPEGTDLDNMTIWVAPDMHFVQYTIRPGELFNQVAVFRSYKFQPGHELMDDWGTPEELDEHYAPLCPQVRAAVRKIKRDRRWPMLDRLPIPNWTRNRITLMGDAAHPMLQYIAQGACQALEDAVCLGDNLRRYPGDPTSAFLAYQRPRIERTARVQRTARLFGEIKHIHGIGVALRNALLRKRADDDFEYFEWLYGYRGCV